MTSSPLCVITFSMHPSYRVAQRLTTHLDKVVLDFVSPLEDVPAELLPQLLVELDELLHAVVPDLVANRYDHQHNFKSHHKKTMI